MKVLIVYAHPEPNSFNGAMKDAAVAALTQAGHQVTVSDLYALKFNPVAESVQFVERADPAFFNLQNEQRHAAETGTIATDVAAEHAKLFWAELIIFQFPLWWGSMPAIMKGYIDRVFSVATVYGRGLNGLQGRKALLAVTASGRKDHEEGARNEKAELSHVLNNMLALPRLEALDPFFVFGPGSMTAAERADYLKEYQSRLLAIAGAM